VVCELEIVVAQACFADLLLLELAALLAVL
jgi:hypothetical protein